MSGAFEHVLATAELEQEQVQGQKEGGSARGARRHYGSPEAGEAGDGSPGATARRARAERCLRW